MRKIIIGGIGVVLGATTVLASGAFASNPDSNGAQMAQLHLNQQSGPLADQCSSGGSDVQGFTILNAPGNPAAGIDRVNGEISLKNGIPGTYEVELASDGTCQPTGAFLTTNATGFGNAHVDMPTSGASFYVVLRSVNTDGSTGDETYASDPVTLH